YAVLRLSPDQVMTDILITPAARGYELGISNNGNRPYNTAILRVGMLPEVSDSFGAATNTANGVILDTYPTGYGFAGGWMPPTNPFAAKAEIGRPNRFSDPEPIA